MLSYWSNSIRLQLIWKKAKSTKKTLRNIQLINMSHQKSPAIASNPCGKKQHQSRISANLEHIKHNLRSDLPIRLHWLTFKLNTRWIIIHKNTSQLPTVGRWTSCRPTPPKQASKGRANTSQKHPSVDESKDRKATIRILNLLPIHIGKIPKDQSIWISLRLKWSIF